MWTRSICTIVRSQSKNLEGFDENKNEMNVLDQLHYLLIWSKMGHLFVKIVLKITQEISIRHY